MAFDKTRLWEVLKTIPSPKQKEVLAFVKSINIGKQNDLELLLRVLLVNMSKGKIPTRLKIWAKVWHNELYDDVKLRRKCSYLLHQVENWLLLQTIDLQNWERERQLCSHFTKISATKLANYYHNSIKSAKEKSPYRDLNYYYGNLLDNETSLDLQTLLDAQIFDIKATSQDLDIAFVLSKLKNGIRAYWANSAGGEPIDALFMPEIIATIPKNEVLKTNPSVTVYYHLYLLFVENQLDSLQKTENIVAAIDFLSQPELNDIYLMVENFISLGIQKKVLTHQHLADWYDKGNELGLLSTNGVILSLRLQNIISSFLFTGQFEKAKHFLTENKDNIVEQDREDIYNLNLSHICFYQKKYKKAIQLGLRITPQKPIPYLLARRILLKTYYMENEQEVLNNALDSFQHYLYVTQRVISKNSKEGNLNFAKVLRKLNNARTMNRPSRLLVIQKIKQFLLTNAIINERVWLEDVLANI
jgi:hypothetical protein